MAGLDRLAPWSAAGLAAFLQPWTLLGLWLTGKSIYLLVA
jgi:hypothetical protein